MTGCFNILECGGNILDRLDVKYERLCMAIPKNKHYNTLLKTLVDYNNHNNAPLSNEKLQQEVGKVMDETEAELKRNMNKIKIYTSFKSPVKKKDISTINDSGYNESNNQVDKISDSEEQVDMSSRSNTDSIEQVDSSKNPRVDTKFADIIKKLLIRPITFDS